MSSLPWFFDTALRQPSLRSAASTIEIAAKLPGVGGAEDGDAGEEVERPARVVRELAEAHRRLLLGGDVHVVWHETRTQSFCAAEGS
jgi:hypothetical protein